MTGPCEPSDDLAVYGFAATILLAYTDDDHTQVAHLVDADTDRAIHALLDLAAGLAGLTYGDQVRQCLHSIATAAELDAIGRNVTG